MKQQLLELLIGSAVIELSGENKERFFNVLAHHNISIFQKGEKKKEEHHFTIEIYEYNLPEFTSLAKKYGMEIISIKKHGLKELGRYYGRRVGFWIGAVGCLVFLFVMSQCIWSFECIGNSYHSEEAIVKYLKAKNIKYGCFSKKINLKKEALAFRKSYSDIAWCDFSIDGCCLVITIRESVPISKEKTEHSGWSIVAPHAGTITSIITRTGTPTTKAGKKVKKGETLIHGYLVYKNDANEIVSYKTCIADGDITGIYKKKVQLKVAKHLPSEDILSKTEQYFMQVSGKQYRFTAKKIPVNKKVGVLTEYIQIPVFYKIFENARIVKETIYHYPEKEKYISKKEAQAYFENKLKKIMKKIEEKNGKILEKKLHIEDNSKEVLLSGVLYVEGNFKSLRKTELPPAGKEKNEP